MFGQGSPFKFLFGLHGVLAKSIGAKCSFLYILTKKSVSKCHEVIFAKNTENW